MFDIFTISIFKYVTRVIFHGNKPDVITRCIALRKLIIPMPFGSNRWAHHPQTHLSCLLPQHLLYTACMHTIIPLVIIMT